MFPNFFSMLLQTPCISRIARTWPRRTQWRRFPRRYYASTSTDDVSWFQQLRDEMLQRDMTHFREHIAQAHEHKLMMTITGFLPKEWCWEPGWRRPVLPVGHHLIWFNAAVPTQELLPDGTDASQSPGHPWVRRMWAGGSLQINPDNYVDPIHGFRLDAPMLGAERIKDVQLRGEGDAAKIFVTIERRFARTDTVEEKYRSVHGSLKRRGRILKTQQFFEEQLRNESWDDVLLKEERNLVFFKERTPEEVDAIKAGQLVPVKYLSPPGTPHFSHSFTPDRHLLFRFSALTFNAHLIHLDRDYARNVEGHRNLLVHGPLSLILMLQGMHKHLDAHTDETQVVESIEYRNLAPLYCDEEMRICGMEKKTLRNSSVYEVWIEGPTGGVAVKGTVYTTTKKIVPTPALDRADTLDEQASVSYRPISKRSNQKKEVDRTRVPPIEGARKKQLAGFRRLNISAPEPKPDAKSPPFKLSTPEADISSKSESETKPPPSSLSSKSDVSPGFSGESPQQPASIDRTSQPSSREVTPSTHRAYRRNRPTRIRSHQFIPPPITSLSPVSRVPSLTPTPRSKHRNIMRRYRPIDLNFEPIPIVRTVPAKPYKPDPHRTAQRHSRFLREGARKVEKLTIRRGADALWREEWRRRKADWQQRAYEHEKMYRWRVRQ